MREKKEMFFPRFSLEKTKGMGYYKNLFSPSLFSSLLIGSLFFPL